MKTILAIFFSLIIYIGLNAQNDLMQVSVISELNSDGEDYASLLLDTSTMLFSSSRPYTLSEKILSGNHNIYISRKEGEKWSAPEMISYLSNSDNHETPVGLSPDRKTIYIYKTFYGGDIYLSELKDNYPGPLRKAPFNSGWHESSACFSNDTYYFVSDRPGGKGGHDIYFCTANGKRWSEPVNLEILNTEKDENYLYITAGGDSLYFSSRGFDSVGGYDVFRSVRKSDGQWSEPVNMGTMINTAYDEIYYNQDPSGIIFFSSNRPDSSNAGYNIYMCKEKKVRVKVPLELAGNSSLVESKTGTVDLIKKEIGLEGYMRYIPEKIEVDISSVTDTFNVIFVGDLKVNSNLTVLDDKSEAVISIKKQMTQLENLSLEEVKKNIDFEIRFCAVQVGAFSKKTSIEEFAIDFPLLADKVVMIKHQYYNRFVMKETFKELDSAIVLQKKCITEYNSVPDTFVGVYGKDNKRVIIYFDYVKNSFKMLKPEEQFEDDVLE